MTTLSESRLENGEGSRSKIPKKRKLNCQSEFAISDLKVFDCPICYKPLTSPVFECVNGHAICLSCCSILDKKCPTCNSLIDDKNCKSIEKVLESAKAICQNAKYGCKETMSCSEMRDHDKICYYVLCSCPFSDCKFVGSCSQVYEHFSAEHKSSALCFQYDTDINISMDVNEKFLVLQAEKDGVLFILNNKVDPLGNIISVSCIASSLVEGMYSYGILVVDGQNNLRLQGSTNRIHNRVDDDSPPMRFVLVPTRFFFRSNGKLKLSINIKNFYFSVI